MVADPRTCIRTDLDCADICADICATSARVLSRHAGMHEHCRVCAEACRECETACRELLAAIA